ncbi:MAG: PPC domain-containing protein [Planctomycetota bacterium]|nr:PPC domain-containing protein [Planctomycetota bacterium]
MRQRFIACCSLATVLVVGLFGSVSNASSPSLTLIMPRGIQRGQESVLTFSGARLENAEEVFFYTGSFSVKKIEQVSGSAIKVTVAVDANCRLGEHIAQVRTKSGISEFRSFYVGAFPQVDEKEQNGSFEEAQSVSLNVTVAGVVQGEDVDYYVVEAKKGQRLSAEVEGIRLGTYLFDPYIAILDSKRFELSGGDDIPLVRQDSLASIVVPEDGKYYVQIRESSYGGNGNCRYRLHIGTFPRPTHVYPAGGPPGTEMEVTCLGDPTGDFKQKFKVPMENDDRSGVFPQTADGVSPSPIPFRVFEHGNVLETEPNETAKTACAAALPNAFNGIISKPGDVDFFKFAAKKGQVFEVECFARRIRSGLDPVMNVYYADGRSIAGNDDSRGPDSYFRFTVPADGDYVIRVTDHLGRGKEDFVYRIEFHPVKAKLTLGIPRVDRYSQYRQAIFVARGNRFATLVSASRANFGGEIKLDGNGLPAGVKMNCETMPANMTLMPVVFEAAADAPIGGKLVDFTGRLTDPKVKVAGGYSNTADFVLGQPNNTLYYPCVVKKLPIVVVDSLPFEIELQQPKAPLVKNGSMNLKVIVKRKEGFKGAVNVQFPFRPPGIGTRSSVTIAADKNEGYYPLNASGSAQVKTWPIYVLGSSNVGGSAWVSSQLATLEIAEPFVNFEMQRTSCEQGEETQILCKLNHNTAFEGKAKAQIFGLPSKVTTDVLEFDKDTKELIFKIKTEKASPAGKHKNVFCQVTITKEAEPVVARAGSTELQIDKPLPPPPNAPPKPAPKKVVVKAEPKPKKAKPLSRLEKLRLAAKEAREAQKDE